MGLFSLLCASDIEINTWYASLADNLYSGTHYYIINGRKATPVFQSLALLNEFP